MVAEIRAPADERHHPASGLAVEDEHDRGAPGAFSELAPGFDRAEQLFEPAYKRLAHGR
jgi:hypothetical protein